MFGRLSSTGAAGASWTSGGDSLWQPASTAKANIVEVNCRFLDLMGTFPV